MQNFLNQWKKYAQPFPYQIYCDMDGVLVDLISGVLQAANLDIDDQTKRTVVKKIIATGWAWTKKHPDPTIQKGLDYIHSLIGNNVDFWAELPTMPGKDELWGYISQYDPNILSHPWDEDSAAGKEIWLANKLSPAPQMVFLSGDKHMWAVNEKGRPNVLIDDFEKYTIPWEKAGGIAIIHTSAQATIEQLEAIKRETS